MQNRIVVLKKGVDKREVVASFCCFGAIAPYVAR